MGPRHSSRIQPRSLQVTVDSARAAATSTSGTGPLPGATTLGSAGSASGAHFAHGVHQAAVADRSQQEWEREIEAENAGAQVAIGDGDRMAGAEGDVFIDAAIFSECDLAFGAAIEIVEDRPGHTALGEGAKICDADHAGRGGGAGGSGHSVMSVPRVVSRPPEN